MPVLRELSGLKADQPGQPANVRDLVVFVEAVGWLFMTASHECLVLDFHVVCGK